jgi:hypothetical protein
MIKRAKDDGAAANSSLGIDWQTRVIAKDDISKLEQSYASFECVDEFAAVATEMESDSFFDNIRTLIASCDEILRESEYPETSKRIWVHPEKEFEIVKPEEGMRGSPWVNHLAAIWVQEQTADFSDVWYAARIGFKARLYLEHVEKGHAGRPEVHFLVYELGSLHTDWLWRKGRKRSILRGNSVLNGSRAGGVLRSRQFKDDTEKRMKEMQRHLDNGQSLNRAAELAAESGIGPSKEANRKLWQRRKKSLS